MSVGFPTSRNERVKSNQRLSNILILTARCAVWLRGMMHTAELDSAVWCTPWRFLRNWVTWLCVGKHTAEFDSTVCITPCSQTTLKMSISIFSKSWCLSTTFYWKKSELKKISWTICDFPYNFHSNIFRYHRKITIIKFWTKTDTWQVTDSAVWCTPPSLTLRRDEHPGARLRSGMHTAEFFQILFFMTPRCDAHRVAWLCGRMHTTELDSGVWCTPWSQTPRDDAHRRAFKEFEYLREIKTEFENILAWLSGV